MTPTTLAVSGACNDPHESVVVTAAEPPGIRVVKEATPLSRPEPGGTFSFKVTVTNTSAEPLTITGLHDDVYGDVGHPGHLHQGGGHGAPGRRQHARARSRAI